MIYNKISNIELYKGLSEDIFTGLKYLTTVDASVENGVHQISDKVRAVVLEYKTKKVN